MGTRAGRRLLPVITSHTQAGRATGLAATGGHMQQTDYHHFAAAVYRAVQAIPPGCVATYGQLAILAGRPAWARQAGRAMAGAPAHLPCHRVVNSAGRLAPGWGAQRALLHQEGVTFRPNGHVNMRRHRWRPY